MVFKKTANIAFTGMLFFLLCLPQAKAESPFDNQHFATKIYADLQAVVFTGLEQAMAFSMPPPCIILINPGFDSNLSQWTKFNGPTGTTDSYAGTHGALLNNFYTTLSQANTGIVPGRVYTLSAYGKTTESPSARLIINFKDASNNQLSQAFVDISALNYTQYYISATAPSNAVTIEVIASKFGIGTLKVDELCLEETIPIVGQCILTHNAGFENGMTNWTISGGTVTNSAESHSGASGAEIISNGANVYQNLGILSGETYELSAWAKVSTTAPSYAELFIKWLDVNENLIHSVVQPVIPNTTGYTKFSLKGKAPANAVYAQIGGYKTGGTNQVFYVDDFCFSKTNTLGGNNWNQTCGCSENLLPNGHFEEAYTSSFPYAVEGIPAAAISNGNTATVKPWSTSTAGYSFYLNDNSGAVNNPEGNRFVLLPNNGDKWSLNTHFSDNLKLVDGETYNLCFHAAAWNTSLDFNGLPDGGTETQLPGVVKLGLTFQSGYQDVAAVSLPANETFSNLHWVRHTLTFTYSAIDPIVNLIFENNRANAGILIDAVSLSKVSCPAEIACGPGGITFERWTGISGSNILDLITNPNFPNNYAETGILTSFQGALNYSSSYGTRVYGYLIPSQTGNYSFNVTSDDNARLYLSPDQSFANKSIIASVPGWTNPTEHTKFPEQTSTNISLLAGQKYYIELVHKEGGGSDHFQVYWKTPSSGTWTIIPGANLSPVCYAEDCANGKDDDFDGLTDCADPDCGSGVNISYIVTDENCGTGGGAIDLTVTGASLPVAYHWSDMAPDAWWTFDGSTDDYSGGVNHNNGIAGNIIYVNDAVQGRTSAYFDGNTYIRYSVDNGFMEKAFSALTVSMWVKPDNLNSLQTLFDEGGSTGGKGLAIRLTNNLLVARVKEGGSTATSDTHIFPNDGQWHHVAAVFDNGLFTVFLDGVPGPVINAGFTTIKNHGNNGGIGASIGGSVLNSSGTIYKGKMDDVRYFYEKALNADQIADMARNDGDRSNLFAGDYMVNVFTAAGCTVSSIITILSTSNHTDGGTVSGDETSCLSSYDPGLISSNTSASGGGAGTTEYQWQKSTDNGNSWADIPGAVSETFDPGVISIPTHFRRGGRLNPCLAWIYSNVVVKNFTVNPVKGGVISGTESYCGAFDPAIISSDTLPSGGSGGTLEFQWQQSLDSVIWNDIAGATAATFDPLPITQTTIYRRGARRSPCADFIFSNEVVKMVVENYTDPGIIAGDQSNCGSFDPGLISSVTKPSGGADGTLVHQWQLSTDGGATWSNISGANSETLNPVTIIQTTLYRRGARRSPCADFIYSNVITKSVVSNFTSGGIISGDQSTCGSYDPFIISNFSSPSGGSDGIVTYQWQSSTNSGASWSTISGATNITYDPPVINQTTWFRRQARRAPCSAWINSSTVIKTVKPAPATTIETYPTSTNGYLCEWTTYTFQAADLGPGATYAWDFGAYATPQTASGKGPHEVAFNVPNGAASTDITVSLTGSVDGCSATDTRNLSIRPQILVTDISLMDPTDCNEVNGSIAITTSHPVTTTVSASIDGGSTWVNEPLDFTGLTAGSYEILLRYVDGECPYAWGNVTLTEPANLTADIQLSAIETCENQTFTVEAIPTSGTSPTFSWNFGTSATPATATGVGPHTVSYSAGGQHNIALTIQENFCSGFVDTVITVVSNYSHGGIIEGDEDLCTAGPGGIITSTSAPGGGSGGTNAYQWEYSEDDGSGGWTAWTEIAGANGDTLVPDTISITTKFRRKAQRTPCANWVLSNEITKRMAGIPSPADDLFNSACPGFLFFGYVNLNDGSLSNPVYTLVTPPLNGTLDLDTDGEFVYTPNSFFCGTDQFTYRVCNNGTSCCATAVATIDLADDEVPVLQNIPSDILISCDDEIPLPPIVDAWENCQTVTIGMDEATNQGEQDSCSIYSYDLTRIWTASDYCGNNGSAQQVLSIQDNTAPDIYRIYTLPNGAKMVAGVMENVSHRWKTIKFPVQFSTKPVVFAQVATANDTTAVVTRMRNITTSQFQLRLQEEENQDGIHGVESVSWIAIEPGTHNGASPFEVNSKLVSSSLTNIAFEQTYTTPGFIGTIQTFNENNPANLRISSLSGIEVNVFCQEETSFDPETNHGFETVGYLALSGSGNFTNNQGEVVGETGRVTLDQNYLTVNLQHSYHNPVVVLGGITMNDGAPATIRVKNITAHSFSVRVEEWEYLDGIHSPEDLTYLVVEGSIPFDRIVECSNIPAPPVIGTDIVGKDNCDISTPLTITDSPFVFNCDNDTLFTRTYYVQDECGNTTTLTQAYILRDTTPPVFTPPANITITCTIPIDSLAVLGDVLDETDNCATGLEAAYTDNLSFLFGCNGYVLRTWSLTDFCGNTTTHTQTITVYNDNDADGDGLADAFDLDDDNDGIPDVDEGDGDTDGDGIPNSLDLDSDNDGIPDLVEAGFPDANGDGIIDSFGQPDWDIDGDGLANEADANDNDPSLAASDNFNPLSMSNDRDGDGIPNFLDLDSDNDGIPDLIEAGGADENNDGMIDYPIPGDPTSMQDADGDGFGDQYDPDDDSSFGIDEAGNILVRFFNGNYFGGDSGFNPDSDGDGVPNFYDLDSDNDGITDLIESGGVDTNGDGVIDSGEFSDVNQNGFDDTYENMPLVITEGDGGSGTGIPIDGNGDGTTYLSGDHDMDGIPNYLDTDSDDDGIFDLIEIGFGHMDSNGDGSIDASFVDSDNNGLNDASTGVIFTDGDGATNDGIPEDDTDVDTSPYNSTAADGAFGQPNGQPDIDDDGDGIPNFLDTDSDDDGILDQVEDANGNGIADTGETGYLNPDSDGDLIPDGVEDANQDGIYDPATETNPLNIDTDGDGIEDGVEDENKNGIVDGPTESDPRDPCDPIANPACIGIVLDIKMRLLGPLIENGGSNLMRDDLRASGNLPNLEPYSFMSNFEHKGEGGSEFFDVALLDSTGANAIVDWIFIELRSVSTPDLVTATRAAILQRDGDVVDVDGVSPVRFDHTPSGDYFVAVRHRNHLGASTLNSYTLSPTPTVIDFSDPATETYGAHAQAAVNDKMALWPGDLNADRKVIYQGPGNDAIPIFFHIMTRPENTNSLANFITFGYDPFDLNMDGKTIYQGPGNDRAKILIYTVLSNPLNVNSLANFIILEKLP